MGVNAPNESFDASDEKPENPLAMENEDFRGVASTFMEDGLDAEEEDGIGGGGGGGAAADEGTLKRPLETVEIAASLLLSGFISVVAAVVLKA